MRYLLDTNIISNIIKPSPSHSLMAWMGEQNDTDLYISALTLAEIQRGILELPKGKRRESLEKWFVGPQGPQTLFAGRILPFDEAASLIWAQFMADSRLAGRPKGTFDMMIAAIASANNCVVAT